MEERVLTRKSAAPKRLAKAFPLSWSD